MIKQRQPASRAVRITGIRPLVEADLELLRDKSVGSIPRIQRLRDSHHQVARLFAQGLKIYEIARITGHSLNSISRYQRDPAAAELIAHYRALKTEEWLDEQDQIAKLGTEAMTKSLRHINDHFDDADAAGELVPLPRALAVASDMMDRFGYGKKSAQLNFNVDFAANLEKAIARTKKVAAE